MIVEGRFSFDTNILVCSVDRDAGERHEKASALLKSAGKGNCVLTLQALGEFFKVATRKKPLEAADAKHSVLRWSSTFSIAAADEKSLADSIARFRGTRSVVLEREAFGRATGRVRRGHKREHAARPASGRRRDHQSLRRRRPPSAAGTVGPETAGQRMTATLFTCANAFAPGRMPS